MTEERKDYGTAKGNEILRILWETYGEKEVSKWCASILESLQQTKVLRPGVHGKSTQIETAQGNKLDDHSLPCKEHIAGWLLRDMWEQQECGRSPQGRESAEQQQGKLDESMQELSFQNTSSVQNLCDMWSKGEGLWLLRQTLSAFQKTRQSVCGEKGQRCYAVRRLTPRETERLQGLPDDWTLIDHKTCSDSARYKAVGNGMCQNIADFLIKRIVEEMGEDQNG